MEVPLSRPSEAYRELFRNLPTAVVIATTMHEGHAHATTVSSFCGISLEPALVSISLHHTSRLLAALECSRRLGINVLGEDQHRQGAQCADKGADRMGALAWREDEGLPRLEAGAAWMDCDVTKLIVAGDHTIVLAAPREIATTDRTPLLYHQQAFRLLGDRVA